MFIVSGSKIRVFVDSEILRGWGSPTCYCHAKNMNLIEAQ